jgi:hypothetical protein
MAKSAPVWRGNYPALEELGEMPPGGNHGCLQFGPAMPWDGIGVEDRDWHD